MATNGGSSSSNPTRTVKFKTSDSEDVEVPVEIAMEFDTVRNFFDGDPNEVKDPPSFKLSHVTKDILLIAHDGVSKILELEKELQEVKAEFFGQHTDETIVKLVQAADYLGIEKLLDFMIPSVWKRFGIEDDEDADFVYKGEFEKILRMRAEPRRVLGGADEDQQI